MSMNIVDKIDNRVAVRNVPVSVSDKTGLENLIPEIRKASPGVRFLSTGGTFKRLQEILGSASDDSLTQVAAYTGQPETQGGLVKTLDFKIYLGLLTETYNPDHRADLTRTGAVAIDMVIVNLYPFRETIAKENVTVEMARGNIDIGGPCMIRASAKNFIRVASVVDPGDYPHIIDELKHQKGATSLALRYQLACKAFDHTADYDRSIADYLASQADDDVQACYSAADG